MGFSNQERINLNTAILQGATIDANSISVWYEKVFNNQFVLPSNRIWGQFASIPEANTVAVAKTNAAQNPTIIEDLSDSQNAVRLTKIPGTNNSTFASYQGYNDFSTSVVGNWIQPQQITQRNGVLAGQPSFGYTVTLYDGDPANGGVIIPPTTGTTGTGTGKTVGWIFNYATGILLLSADFYVRAGISPLAFDPYITGFRYIGTTAESGGVINPTEVAFGSGDNQITGDADFTYDDLNGLLEVEKIKGQIVVRVRNETGSSIQSGSAVYVASDGSGGVPLVELASANSSNTMPSIGIVSNTIDDGNNGYAVISGQLNGLDGSLGNTVFDSQIVAGDVGKTVYVSPINPGRMTITRPLGSSEPVQNVGRIIDITGNNIKIAVSNIGRTNDVPNSFSTTGNIDAGSLTVNNSYTFPSADGTDGSALISDGAGNLSFSEPNSIYSFYTCDETIAKGDILRFVVANDAPAFVNPNYVVRAIGTHSLDQNYEAFGVAASSGNQGDSIKVITFGNAEMTFAVAPTSNQIGKDIYLSSVDPGKGTFTPPSSVGDAVIKIGKALSGNGVSTTINVNINIDTIILL